MAALSPEAFPVAVRSQPEPDAPELLPRSSPEIRPGAAPRTHGDDVRTTSPHAANLAPRHTSAAAGPARPAGGTAGRRGARTASQGAGAWSLPRLLRAEDGHLRARGQTSCPSRNPREMRAGGAVGLSGRAVPPTAVCGLAQFRPGADVGASAGALRDACPVACRPRVRVPARRAASCLVHRHTGADRSANGYRNAALLPPWRPAWMRPHHSPCRRPGRGRSAGTKRNSAAAELRRQSPRPRRAFRGIPLGPGACTTVVHKPLPRRPTLAPATITGPSLAPGGGPLGPIGRM
jgi:hypothetical protein